MHKLTRGAAPKCLSRYNYRAGDTWQKVTPEHKAEIWEQLENMQGSRCAYCECEISKRRNSHIEHFRQRRASSYPKGTFEWYNLFGSCNRSTSCGKHKDAQTYHHTDLIKMDDEDPETFFSFLPDGQVATKGNLLSCERHRAEETIRVFNLNGPLRQIRETHIKGYIQTAEVLAELSEDCSQGDWEDIVNEELEAISGLPFETAIRHVLSPNE